MTAAASAVLLASSFIASSHAFVPSASRHHPLMVPSATLTHQQNLKPRSMLRAVPTPDPIKSYKSVRWAPDAGDQRGAPVIDVKFKEVENLNLSTNEPTTIDPTTSATPSNAAIATEEAADHSAATPALPNTGGKGLAKLFDFAKTKHAALAATVLLMLTMTFNPLPSEAVMSGGSMGGSFGASSRRQSYSAPARTYSSPSYGSSYGSGFNRGFSSGYYSRPSVVVNPIAPIMPSPFYSPFYAPSYYSRPGVVVSSGGGFGLFGFVTFMGFALAALTAVNSFVGSAGSGVLDRFDEAIGGALGPGVSVAEISVAIDVPNRDDPNSILSVLNRLSNTARTDSRVGMSNLTSQVALELLRRKNQIAASSTRSKHFRDSNKASRDFNSLAVTERGKFERESRKFGGVDYSQSQRGETSGEYNPKATMAVITLLVAIEGDSTELPVIRSQSDLEEALAKIAADVKVDDCLQSAEILWTPEERTETLSMKDIVGDYPELRSI
eukprot:CAMPEP_0181029914 /NCGR_PEP_ID=MMETSP1070-20121207/5449_1 /TAXON_ID=265543 /ORGANISM="Minutocellus polymorphus, Strain NH13" /LENGTH=496 /DNA_ID=CAMNT_0023107249 /DNA_START=68 /DNA_END=1558 /DNA_ORIENTATION=-